MTEKQTKTDQPIAINSFVYDIDNKRFVEQNAFFKTLATATSRAMELNQDVVSKQSGEEFKDILLDFTHAITAPSSDDFLYISEHPLDAKGFELEKGDELIEATKAKFIDIFEVAFEQSKQRQQVFRLKDGHIFFDIIDHAIMLYLKDGFTTINYCSRPSPKTRASIEVEYLIDGNVWTLIAERDSKNDYHHRYLLNGHENLALNDTAQLILGVLIMHSSWRLNKAEHLRINDIAKTIPEMTPMAEKIAQITNQDPSYYIGVAMLLIGAFSNKLIPDNAKDAEAKRLIHFEFNISEDEADQFFDIAMDALNQVTQRNNP